MSLEAITWAFRQEVPGTAKLVLLALANRADDETGECWPGVTRVAKDASCSVRSAQIHIAALARNGFIQIERRRSSGDGRQQSNRYWVLMDRAASPWKSVHAENTEDDDGGAESAPHTITTEDTSEEKYIHSDSPPPVQPASPPCIEPSRFESSTTEQVEIGGAAQCAPMPAVAPQAPAQAERPKAAADGSKPRSFDPKARQREIERLAAAEEARRRSTRTFVYEDTDGWKSWCRLKQSLTGIGRMFANWSAEFQRKGAWLPSLFPPRPEEIAGLSWSQIVAGERAKASGDRMGERRGDSSPESSDSLNDLANEMNGTGR